MLALSKSNDQSASISERSGAPLTSNQELDRWADDGGKGNRGPGAVVDSTADRSNVDGSAKSSRISRGSTPKDCNDGVKVSKAEGMVEMVTHSSISRADAKKVVQTWFALADEEYCRLFRFGMTQNGSRHVEEQEGLMKSSLEQEYPRPMTEGGGRTHYVEEQERRFAGAIVNWLQKKAVEHEFDRLMIFAAPRMLGALRKVPHGSLNFILEETKGDLMRLASGQLAEHPLIRELTEAAHGAG